MVDFARLSKDWIEWSNWMRMAKVSVVGANEDHLVGFVSDDGSFFLRQANGWWVLDEVDDRGQRYVDTGNFSNFELIEKYLIWRWEQTLTNAPELGRELYARGMNPEVVVNPTDSEWRFELDSSVGKARLGEPSATIFSYVMFIPTEQIEQRANQAVSPR
ncbi:hypothetical protein [Mycobacteroides abscessus]|uniref:hypothetical protein n=1 Tax=Mycobacteroides abscessus TaxID=36809 RepID=UPI0009CBDE29|nr:hypothetical protein [Mycobacteroides abscessus]MDO2968601.1 hypothetical protein [Mycobacteroides abscessus subsp. bolletii]MDO3081134.1 hypothetical protein [Mycobacteroides abscessus subsp. bolletii]QSM90171.1 hypothetical protein I3U44_05595 [Mycobacteroides abscessus subsp. bolletii]SLC01284.1 Uncharacterised protein [Mycobacteroides abscessus subsp. bolletii]